MNTVKLGKTTFEIDMNRLSVKEYRAIFDDVDGETKGVAKACGMKVSEIEALPWVDYRQLVRAVVQAANEPLEAIETDPNP